MDEEENDMNDDMDDDYYGDSYGDEVNDLLEQDGLGINNSQIEDNEN